MKPILLFMTIVASTTLIAQKETFDIISYNIPKGWKKEVKEAVASFSYTNKKDSSWCSIGIYKSIDSKGSIELDFESEWDQLVTKTYNITDTNQVNEIQEAEGWKIKSGAGKFTFRNKPAAIILTTFSGYGKCVSIIASTANQRYLKDIQDLVASVNLNKPATVQQNASQSPAGFSFTTTDFDDGWTSIVKNDWVEVIKDDVKVYLWYALPYNASDFSGTGVRVRDYYWDNDVTKYFSIESKQYRDDGEYVSSLQPDYVEGWVTDKQTGERRFIAMRLSIGNAAYITIASAKDESAIRQQFPNANGKYTSDLADMSRFNKFAISASDVKGTWQDGNTSTAQWYYVTPGGNEGYAGMTVAARSATFNFNADGNYTSIHNGATGAVGAMNTFQQNYKGKYTVTNWSLTATNRFGGKTDHFEAWFKIVRGGRLLCLKDGSMEYTLVKTK